MWEHAKALPFGRLSKRNILIFVAAMFATIFAYIILAAPTTHAADAQWSGTSITYAQKQYVKISDVQTNDARFSPTLPDKTQVYLYIEPATSGPSSPTKKAHLIYFAPGIEPPKATSATYATYDLTTPPELYKNPGGVKVISLDPQVPDNSKGTTSCDSTFTKGVGWIICPITNFLSSAMDWLYGLLSDFLAVRPVGSSRETALYRAWSYMRNFANVAFVIAFLIIIYSQLTGVGISNYEIKKMLPRLVVAAVLVNISYWICSIAIDVSNILGYSVQDIFIAMRNSLVGTEGNNWNLLNFKSISGFVLSGGTAAAAAGISGVAFVASAGTVGGALYMLLPILLGVLVAVVVALLVMAARQAIITILVIISPLAFVAYLLPNTEKYFKTWHELGTKMLMVFPMFSVVFGGAQLAGDVIIQNADSINLVILGSAVKVAPVIITPILIKLSGSLLGKIAGIVNNPGKGFIDRTRNWAQERSDQRKAHAFTKPLNRRRDAFARASRALDNQKRRRDGQMKADEATNDASWANTRQFSDIQQQMIAASQLKEAGENNAQRRYEVSKLSNSAAQELDINARASKVHLDLSKASVEANWEEIKAGSAARIVTPQGLAGNALSSYIAARDAQVGAIRDATLQSTVEARRGQSAHHVQQEQYSDAMLKDAVLRQQAGGISEHGADSALAAATAERRKAYGTAIGEANEIVKHFNLSNEDRQKHAMGIEVTKIDGHGNTRVFTASDVYTREAVIDAQVRNGTVDNALEIIAQSGSSLKDFKTTIRDAAAEGGLAGKTFFIGGQTQDMIGEGHIKSYEHLLGVVQDNIARGKISADKLVNLDKDAVAMIVEAANRIDISYMDPNERLKLPNALEGLKKSASKALTDSILNVKIPDNIKPKLEELSTLRNRPNT